ARAVRAEEAERLPGLDREIDAVDGHERSEALRERARFDHRTGHLDDGTGQRPVSPPNFAAKFGAGAARGRPSVTRSVVTRPSALPSFRSGLPDRTHMSGTFAVPTRPRRTPRVDGLPTVTAVV